MVVPSPPPPADLVTAAKRVNRAMAFLGAACIIAGARFFLAPGELDRTSVGRALPGLWDEAWSAAFLVGGLLVLIGVLARRPRLELPGITLAGTATLVQGGALFIVNGPRAIAQLPLYALAVWVFDGRARDLRDLPRERRHGHHDPRPSVTRVERRLMVGAAPVLIFAADASANGPNASTFLLALLGGGIITALLQALLYRPQRRTLEANLSKTAVESADIALRQALARTDELEEELDEARDRIAILERRIAELEAAV